MNYDAIYYERNGEKIRSKRQARYWANRDEEMRRNRESRAKNGDKWKATKRKKHALNPIPNMLSMAKKRAKLAGLPFELSPTDIVIPELCPVLGVPLAVNGGRYSPSLDRIDNSKGYVRGNVVVVSIRANTIKNDASLDELRRVVRFYEALK